MEFNSSSAVSRFGDMARFFGEETEGLSLREQADLSLRAVKRLLVDLDVARSFTSDQVDAAEIPTMAKMAVIGAYGEKLSMEEIRNYPEGGAIQSPNIRKATYEDAVKLYHKSLEGWTL